MEKVSASKVTER